MKQIYVISAFLLSLLSLAACTHNDGGEEILYGQWQLTSAQSEGDAPEVVVEDGSKVYWRFQGSTIQMSAVYSDHGADNRYGNYRLSGTTLFLDFPDEETYGEPLLGLPRQCELQIASHSSKNLTLIYNPDAKGQIVYNFRKW